MYLLILEVYNKFMTSKNNIDLPSFIKGMAAGAAAGMASLLAYQYIHAIIKQPRLMSRAVLSKAEDFDEWLVAARGTVPCGSCAAIPIFTRERSSYLPRIWPRHTKESVLFSRSTNSVSSAIGIGTIAWPSRRP